MNELLKIYAKANMQGDFIEYVVAHNELEAFGNSDDETIVQDIGNLCDEDEIERVIYHELEINEKTRLELVSNYLVDRDVKKVFRKTFDEDVDISFVKSDWHNIQYTICNELGEILLVFSIARNGYNVFEVSTVSQTFLGSYHNCLAWAKFLAKIKETWYGYYDKETNE